MMPNPRLLICILLAFLLPPSAWGQLDFEAVRKQAKKSGSSKKALAILSDFADAESTSSKDRILALEYLTRFSASRGRINQADGFVKRARELAECESDPTLLRNVLQIESAIANGLSEFDRGVDAATRCIDIAESIDANDPYLAKPLNERAINYTCLNKFDLAVKDFERAYSYSLIDDNQTLRLHIMINMAAAFDELKMHGKSIKKGLTALELARELDNQRCIASVSVNLANTYLVSLQYAKARRYFDLALDVAKAQKYDSIMGMVCNGLGDLNLIDGRLDDSRASFEKALKAFQRTGDIAGLLETQARILKLNSLERKELADVEQQIEELETLLVESENKQQNRIAIDIIDQLVGIHQERKDWKSVAELLGKRVDYSDDIWSEPNQRALQELDNMQVELDKAHVELEAKNSRVFILIVATAILATMAIILLALWRANHVATNQLRASNIRLRRGQQENTLLEKRLAEQQKVESLATMSAGLLHDFNNYLMAIVSAAELGKMLPDVTRKNELFDTVFRTGMSASDLTKTLSDYLGRGQLTNSVCEVGRTIQSELDVWRKIAGDDIEVVFESNDVTAWVNMDKAQLNQIISNIVKNSSEAINRSGRIRIWLSQFDSNNVIQEFDNAFADGLLVADGLAENENYCRICIQDDGAGMSSKNVMRAMDPYFSTKGVGRGLGLASSSGIVERHDGKLVVQSSVGVGTDVSLILPMAEIVAKEQSLPRLPHPASNALELENVRILLVEDEQSVGEGVKNYLQTHGVQVDLVDKVAAALDLVASESFDCIITDYMLTEMTGRDLATSVKKQFPDMPIILISAYAENSVFDSQLFDCFLGKPFSLNQLLNTVRKTICASKAVHFRFHGRQASA